jgi:HK97 gp10 family phage protein
MASIGGWYVVFNRLPAIMAAVEVQARRAPIATAEEVAVRARANAPVDTGYLQGSIAAVPVNQHMAEVRVGAPYGGYVEFGTSKMAAQPFLSPALGGAAESMLQKIAGALGA